VDSLERHVLFALQPHPGCGARRARDRVSSQRWLPPLLWAAFILILTSIPGSHLPVPPLRNLDKIVHLSIYAVLGWLSVRAWSNGSRVPAAAIAVVILISCFGALDEWHQQFIPLRSTDLLDWAADTMGAAIGAILATTIQRWRVSA
jgi:VanZ family protein